MSLGLQIESLILVCLLNIFIIYAKQGDLLLEKHRTQQSEERKKSRKH